MYLLADARTRQLDDQAVDGLQDVTDHGAVEMSDLRRGVQRHVAMEDRVGGDDLVEGRRSASRSVPTLRAD